MDHGGLGFEWFTNESIFVQTLLPSNLCFKEWEALVRSTEDVLIVDCLKYGFLVG